MTHFFDGKVKQTVTHNHQICSRKLVFCDVDLLEGDISSSKFATIAFNEVRNDFSPNIFDSHFRQYMLHPVEITARCIQES